MYPCFLKQRHIDTVGGSWNPSLPLLVVVPKNLAAGTAQYTATNAESENHIFSVFPRHKAQLRMSPQTSNHHNYHEASSWMSSHWKRENHRGKGGEKKVNRWRKTERNSYLLCCTEKKIQLKSPVNQLTKERS